jgi:hypothetical protein
VYADLPLLFCRSWLASDGGLSANINIGCTGLFAGKPAPTGLMSYKKIVFDANTVGANLLVKLVCRLTETLQSITSANRPAGRPPRALLRYTPPREAERRFCAVGNPAWMPG